MLYDPKWKRKEKRKTKTLSLVFTEAADLIRDRGHSIGKLVDDEGRLCLYGAINLAMHGDPVRCTTKSTNAVDKLRPLLGGEHPVRWNNEPERTRLEVVGLLRKAARALSKG